MFAKYGTSARLQIDYTYMNFHVVAKHALREKEGLFASTWKRTAKN